MLTPCIACYQQRGLLNPAIWAPIYVAGAAERGYLGWLGAPLCNGHMAEVDRAPLNVEVKR